MVEGYAGDISQGEEGEVEKALIMMRDASILVRRIDQYFSENNLSQLKFLIMIVIDREIDRTWLYQSEISDKLDVSKPVLTRTVQSLLKTGLVGVSKDELDKRAKQLSLTDEGSAVLSKLLPSYFALITDFMRAKKP